MACELASLLVTRLKLHTFTNFKLGPSDPSRANMANILAKISGGAIFVRGGGGGGGVG